MKKSYSLFSRLKSQKGLNSIRQNGVSSIPLMGKNAFDTRTITESVKRVAMESTGVSKVVVGANMMTKDTAKADGIQFLFRGRHIGESRVGLLAPHKFNRYCGGYSMLPCFTRSLASSSASQSSGQTQQQQHRKDISTTDDPFDPLTYNIPEKPVTFVEGASYSVVILAGIAFATAAAYFACKELLFEPKEYKVFGKALERVQNDSQVRVRIGSPIKGYGQETRNRAARQQIPNTTWIDEDGVEHVRISFVIRGPHGTGNVFTEMFKDEVDNEWKYTYLIAEIKTPSPVQLILESYIPA